VEDTNTIPQNNTPGENEMLIEIRDQDGKYIKSINRKPHAEQIGNFNPIFIRYNGKDHLLKSDTGDPSDPFRLTQDVLNHSYITTVQETN
jgi:hypothetical protein